MAIFKKILVSETTTPKEKISSKTITTASIFNRGFNQPIQQQQGSSDTSCTSSFIEQSQNTGDVHQEGDVPNDLEDLWYLFVLIYNSFKIIIQLAHLQSITPPRRYQTCRIFGEG